MKSAFFIEKLGNSVDNMLKVNYIEYENLWYLGAEMEKTIKCPVCKHELDVSIPNGSVMIVNKPLKELPYIVWCDNCKRKIKYDIEKVKEN